MKYMLYMVMACVLVISTPDVNLYSSTSTLDPNCQKLCGTCDQIFSWERACDGDPTGCVVTLCEDHRPNCGYNDNYVDWCHGINYCEYSSGSCILN